MDSALLQLIKKDLKEKKMRGKLAGQSSCCSGGMSSGGTGWQARGELGYDQRSPTQARAPWASSSFTTGQQSQPRSPYAPRPDEVQKLFIANGIAHAISGQELVVQFCPLCEKPHYNARDNMNTLCVNIVSGLFNCFRCGKSGTWGQLKRLLGVGRWHGDARPEDAHQQPHHGTGPSFYDQMRNGMGGGPQSRPIEGPPETFPVFKMKQLMDNLKHNIYESATEYLVGTEKKEQRHLTLETLQKFRVGVGEERFYDDIEEQWVSIECAYFPMYAPLNDKQVLKKEKVLAQKMKDMTVKEKNLLKEAHAQVEGRTRKQEEEEEEDEAMVTLSTDLELVKTKVRAIGSRNKSHQRTLPVGCTQQALFGLPTVRPGDPFLVITEGEYDAMAVHQETQFPCVSLPQGASHLPKQLLDFFDRFEKIYLWLDSDEVGLRSAEKFARVLGPNRTIIIDTNFRQTESLEPLDEEVERPKDANDALRKGLCFKKIMTENARWLD